MRTKTAVTILIIGLMIYFLGLKAISSWVFVRNLETLLRHSDDYKECKIYRNNRVECK